MKGGASDVKTTCGPPEGPYVALLIVRLVLKDFRGEIVRGSDLRAREQVRGCRKTSSLNSSLSLLIPFLFLLSLARDRCFPGSPGDALTAVLAMLALELSTREIPKSPSLRTPPLERKTFCDFRSLWETTRH